MLQLRDCFYTTFIFTDLRVKCQWWEFDVSTLNLFRLTSSVRVSTLFLLFEEASPLFPGTLLFYPHSKKTGRSRDFKSEEQDFIKNRR